MNKIPSQLIKLRKLCDVPLSDFADIKAPANMNDESQRTGFLKLLRKAAPKPTSTSSSSFPKELELNTAAWLSFPEALVSPVSLWLCYQDDFGEEAVLIDEQMISAPGSAMLSGSVSLRFRGHVRSIKVCAGGLQDEARLSVDELYVKRVEAEDRKAG